MKLIRLFILAGGVLAMALIAPPVRATVAFSISPAAVSNTYNGPITLQVTGLTNAETVVVQKFLDANTNGVIDGGDLLWQQYNLTDGASFVIGGVTNNNVPGDTDGTANGTITARLNFQSDFLQTFDGNYLVKLSSPGGHFAPLTNAFTVSNFPYAQKFTGTVASNGVAVPNALVILLPAGANGNPVGGAVANNSGIYTLPAPTGTYLLTAAKSNFVAVFQTGPSFTLTHGATLSANLNLMAATQTISGQMVDANNSSLGLPGLLVPVQTRDNSLLALGITDPNGNFTAGVTANQWKIGGDSASLAGHGYVGLNGKTTVDTTTGSVAGVTLALPQGTACFYGTVKDNLGNPLPGAVAVYGEDSDQDNNGNGMYQSDGYADTNGNYVTVVVGGLGGSDLWQAGIDNQSSWPNYIFSQSALQQNGGTNLTVGNAVRQDFIALLATNQITGNVSFNGAPVSGVAVNANAMIGGASYQAQAQTDSSGNYSMNVANSEDWSVSLNCNGGDSSLDGILGSGNYQCPDNLDVSINNNNAAGEDFVVQPAGGGSGSLGITTASLANATVGVAYTNQLQASGGTTPYTWTLANGSPPLPSALTLSTNGLLSGVPAAGGTNPFSVRLTDYNLLTVTQSFTLIVNPKPVLGSPAWAANQFQMRLTGAAHQGYTVQMSTNLSSAHWLSLFSTNSATTNSFILIDPNATNAQRFYRILIGP
ncbi:MAG TPA: hypothetical protein VIK59_07520 [Verrucomicrobiae bacterium]